MKDTDLTLFTAVLTFIGFAALLGQATYVGNIIQDSTCGPLGCLEVCDTVDDCSDGLSCCATSWGAGMCDKQNNCETLAIFTRTNPVDAYATAPSDAFVPNTGPEPAFYVPLAMVAVSAVFIVLWFIYRAPEQRMQRAPEE